MESKQQGPRPQAQPEGGPQPPQPAEPSPVQPQPPPAQPQAQSPRSRAVRQRHPRHPGAVDRVTRVQFPIALRGYDRAAVDAHLAEIAQLVAELEGTQLRENVVQRALDEVGEQTAGILQHAHETAEEIAARSWAQAEGRIQRAEREAEQIRREADRYAEEVAADNRRLSEERQRLIEDLRQYAEEVLGLADDALERLPELLSERYEEEHPETPAAEAQPDPTEELPAPQPPPGAAGGPAPEPERAASPEPPQPQRAPHPPPPQPAPEGASDGDDFVEGVIRVERRPKRSSS